MRVLITVIAILLLAAGTWAQTTIVTGTAVDSNGNAYFPGTISAYIVLSTGQAPPPGVPASGSIGPFSTAAGGSFSISVPSPFLWQFTICGVPTNIGPRANPSPTQVCFSTTTISISGGSQDITGVLPSPIPLLGPGGGGILANPITSPNPLSFDVNLAFKGPNPYVDATRFGVRAVSGDGFSTTVNCTNGSPNVTIASASLFQNGDGVALYGCGLGTIVAPSAPTVTPSLAAGQTGLLIDVAGPVGATTYCYQLLARTLMGATNVSPETCTATGPATLGLQTNTITTVSLANTIATYTTSAPHGLVVGAQIVITGVATNVFTGQANNGTSVNIPFNGWFKVATVADNTHFTVNLLTDSRNGAITAGTGGTVNYWNSMHIKATETANNYQYYVYGRVSGGTKTLIGTMWPQDVNLFGRLTDVTYLVFDDFGSTVTTFPSPPLYIPTTVPTTGTHDMLATTIVSGAGSTSLILADSAGNTISGQTIIFDDAVTFLKAATYAANLSGGTNGPLYLPEPGNNAGNLGYPFNSPITLGTGATQRIAVMQKGLVRINEPIAMSLVNWVGQTDSNNTVVSFANTISPLIQVKRASPGILGLSSNFIYNIATSMLSSGGSTMMIQDSGGIPSSGAWRDVVFVVGTTTTYSNMALALRGDGAGYDFTNTTLSGSQNGNLTATTPGIYFDGIGNAVFKNLSLSGIGIAMRPPPAGSFILADGVYCQGCYEPYFSWAADATDPISGTVMAFHNVTTDSHSLPIVANYGGHAVTVDIVNENTVSSNNPNVTGSSTPSGTPRMNIRLSGTGGIGTPVNFGSDVRNNAYQANDGTFGRTVMPIDVINRSMSIGPAFSLFTTTGPNTAPTCPVSAGGSVPTGTIYYAYAPIFANGSEGTLSFTCAATTTGGNQTVTLNWAAIPGVAQYNLYRGLNTLSNVGGLNCSPLTFASLPYVDTAASTCGLSGTIMAAGGPAGMRGGLIWGNTIQIGNTLFGNLATPPNGTLLFCSDCTIANPCAGGGTGALAKRLNGVWVCN